ncbi:hypothetical protein CVT25_011700 [Psilocybe cyanescens]|uniref:Uncharacterized protein n=1 Tax=Psilocybe cyanescens TaxID=93625 RepID=A0A409WIK5_PSICY|nr:hypothetical protein CVT25_011700 [Psilocybe cyanescens]
MPGGEDTKEKVIDETIVIHNTQCPQIPSGGHGYSKDAYRASLMTGEQQGPYMAHSRAIVMSEGSESYQKGSVSSCGKDVRSPDRWAYLSKQVSV